MPYRGKLSRIEQNVDSVIEAILFSSSIKEKTIELDATVHFHSAISFKAWYSWKDLNALMHFIGDKGR